MLFLCAFVLLLVFVVFFDRVVSMFFSIDLFLLGVVGVCRLIS